MLENNLGDLAWMQRWTLLRLHHACHLRHIASHGVDLPRRAVPGASTRGSSRVSEMTFGSLTAKAPVGAETPGSVFVQQVERDWICFSSI